MADNTTLPNGDVVALDEVTSVNGVAQDTPPKVQRVRLGTGASHTYDDVGATNPLPTADAAVAQAVADLVTALGTSAPVALDAATITALASAAGQATIETSLTAIVANTDQVEGKLDTLHGDLGTLHTDLGGTYGYGADTTAGTVDVPVGAHVKRVSVIAGSGGSATVTIAGGPTITIPAGGSFDESVPGTAALGGDVVIGGSVASYYVAWVV